MTDLQLDSIIKSLDSFRKASNFPNAKRPTILELCKTSGVPRATLYRKYKPQLEQFKVIQDSVGKSSSSRLLSASRRKNKLLTERNRILTAIAHEYYIKILKLEEENIRLKQNSIRRIK